MLSGSREQDALSGLVELDFSNLSCDPVKGRRRGSVTLGYSGLRRWNYSEAT